jgi:hypothetical protein
MNPDLVSIVLMYIICFGMSVYTGYKLFIEKEQNRRLRTWYATYMVLSILFLIFMTIVLSIRGLPV